MEDLYAAIAAHLRRQRAKTPQRRRDDPPSEVREVAIYARVATAAEGGSSDLDAQVDACLAFARSRGDTDTLSFREVAAWDTLERPRLAELRSAIAHGWVAVVLVTTLDRLTRDPVLLGALRAEWAAMGVAIVAVME